MDDRAAMDDGDVNDPTSDLGVSCRRLTGCTVVPMPADCSLPIRYPAVRPRLEGTECISII